jgi:hypothetical protein
MALQCSSNRFSGDMVVSVVFKLLSSDPVKQPAVNVLCNRALLCNHGKCAFELPRVNEYGGGSSDRYPFVSFLFHLHFVHSKMQHVHLFDYFSNRTMAAECKSVYLLTQVKEGREIGNEK